MTKEQLEKCSKETRMILEKGKGYRSEDAFGEGYRDLKDVAMHETFILENMDIPLTVLLFYSNYLTDEQIQMTKSIINNLEVLGSDKFKYADEFVEMVCELAMKLVGHTKCLWLTSKTAVSYLYLHEDSSDENRNIDLYEISEENYIISDVGYDGALFLIKTET